MMFKVILHIPPFINIRCVCLCAVLDYILYFNIGVPLEWKMNILFSYFWRWMSQKRHLLLVTCLTGCFWSRIFPLLRFNVAEEGANLATLKMSYVVTAGSFKVADSSTPIWEEV